MTSKILAPSVFALLFAGCAQTHGSSSGTSASKVTTASAQRVAGDIVPSQLVALTLPRPTETALLGGSDALAPRKAFDVAVAPQPVIGHEFRRVMKGTDPAAFTFPVDAPQGARVILRTVNLNQSVAGIHLKNATTGAVLDLARDAVNTLHVQHQPLTQGLAAAHVLKDDPSDVRTAPTVGAAAREPGFAPVLSQRILAFDVPTTPGLVRLDVPADVAAAGVIMELQQPASRITLSGVPTEDNYGFGDTAQLTFTLASDGGPIDGATLTGYAELKDHSSTPAFDIVSLGGGTYRATIPLTSTDWQHTGAWGVHVKATGSIGGVPFERDVETGFGYYPAHAQMTAIGVPQITRGADGLIDDIAVDVDVQTLADDRFAVRGTLTYTGTDGAEHPVAAAQTGQTVAAGTGTITLHFSSESIALARVDGPFHIRDVALVSQAYGFTEHRLGLALDLVTDTFKANEIRFPAPAQISLQAQDLIRNGDLAPVL